ncbi:hypothetical protein A3Q56_01881 [Intoshia linei]|uniref:Uncharacterized protein n=1 Tax=Intoshia linei TaxID=1819745 RepID=A0A177B7J4_9BILA|nr:hypothetical protein A3Q56_01881 [Intoshia linei]
MLDILFLLDGFLIQHCDMSVFYFSLFLIIVSVIKCAEIISTIVISRHGDRTSEFFKFKGDAKVWPKGVGEMTQMGKERIYNLGLYIREKYIIKNTLLSRQYIPSEIYVRSSDVDRTIETAYIVGLALYPIETHSNKSASKIHVPVPTHIVPSYQDLVYYRYEDYLTIKFSENPPFSVNLNAVGYGSTIVTTPSLVGEPLDMGSISNQEKIHMTIKVTNKGIRHRSLVWSTQSLNSDTLKRTTKLPIFMMKPLRVELAAGQSSDVILEARRNENAKTVTRLQCHALTTGVGGKMLIIDNKILCEFVDPKLTFSSNIIEYNVLMNYENMTNYYEKSVVITNMCAIDLNCCLTVPVPFYMVNKNNKKLQTMNFDFEKCDQFINHSYEIRIGFNSQYRDDKFSRSTTRYLTIVYSNHIKKEFIKLFATTFYPNLRFNKSTIDFGCVSSNVELNNYLKLSNDSPMDVEFKFFIESTKSNDSELNSNDENFIREEIDVIPKSGTISPNCELDCVVTYNGHKCTKERINLICKVLGGPVYSIPLFASSSYPSYNFSTQKIDLGLIQYQKEVKFELELINTGRVDLNYTQINYSSANEEKEIISLMNNAKYNKLKIEPNKGHVKGGETTKLSVNYTAILPKKFLTKFCIQVGYDDAMIFEITGKAYYLSIKVDLPLYDYENISVEHLKRIALGELKNKALRRLKNADKKCEIIDQLSDCTRESSIISLEKGDYCVLLNDSPASSSCSSEDSNYSYSPEMNIDKSITQFDNNSNNGELPIVQPRKIFISADEIHRRMDYIIINDHAKLSRDSGKVERPRLCDYYLDFEYILLDQQTYKTINIYNHSIEKININIDRGFLINTGFSLDTNKIRDLENDECALLNIYFDSSCVNCSVGHCNATLALNIKNGPQICIQLHVYVTEPELSLSNQVIDFGNTICGHSRMIVTQLRNDKFVSAKWQLIMSNSPHFHTVKTTKITKKTKKKNMAKLVNLNKSNKIKNRQNYFEFMPSNGVLETNEFINIQILFIPTHECIYEERLIISVGNQKLSILCHGVGKEPNIEFSPEILHFGSILPYSPIVEKNFVVKNPCDYPIEIYNLECDKQYIEEEQILRVMKGYDERYMLLLPPREAGEKLPEELLMYYKDKLVDMNIDQMNTLKETISELETTTIEKEKNQYNQLQLTPTVKALARYLNVDLSLEGQVSKNCRGIAVIVHGTQFNYVAKLSKKISHYYHCVACDINNLILDEIRNGKKQYSKKIRSICEAAANQDQSALDIIDSKQVADNLNSYSVPKVLENKSSRIGTISKQNSHNEDALNQNNASVNTELDKNIKSSIDYEITTIKFSHGNDDEVEVIYTPCELPDDLILLVLSNRLAQDDCRNGVVVYGLSNPFCKDVAKMTMIILKALGNRKHIYAITDNFSYSNYMAQVKNIQIEKEAKENEKLLEDERLLNEMSESEYDKLSTERRNHFDSRRLEIKKEKQEKIKIEQERLEKEDMEQKRLEEEMKSNKKGKKRLGAESTTNGKPKGAASSREFKPPVSKQDNRNKDDKDEHMVDSFTVVDSGTDSTELKDEFLTIKDSKVDKSGKISTARKSRMVNKRGTLHNPKDIEEEIKDKRSPKEIKIEQVFKEFSSQYPEFCNVLERWDRSIGSEKLLSPLDKEFQDDNASNLTGNQTLSLKQRKTLKNRESTNDARQKLNQILYEEDDDQNTVKANSEDVLVANHYQVVQRKNSMENSVGIVHLEINRIHNGTLKIWNSVLAELPLFLDIINGLGYGPTGPPLPPPSYFSIVPYPPKRDAPKKSIYFDFIKTQFDEKFRTVNLKSDVYKVQEEIERQEKEKNEASKTSKIEKGSKSSKILYLKKSILNDYKVSTIIDKDKKITKPNIETKLISHETFQPHRWVIPAKSSIEIPMGFRSNLVGQFDSTFNYEIVGTNRLYQLHCRAICTYSTIIRDPRIIFPVKTFSIRSKKDIIVKSFILDKSVYAFGPLLVGKSRERMMEYRYSENYEKLTISNPSKIKKITVKFCFKTDNKFETFTLNPPSMDLQPNENSMLSIWCYPKAPGKYKDTLVICVAENPEPILFDIEAIGTRPEIEIDTKQLHFEKVLLHRKDTKSLILKNLSLLSVDWRLTGLESLGEEFSISQETGTIGPMKIFKLNTFFRATKPINIVKRNIRIEVSDTAGQIGLIQTEIIQVSAEAYDVALDLSFPKGTDGGLDLDAIRVGEEARQICSIKNKGKYELQYSFSFNSTKTCSMKVCKLFSVFPSKGTLAPVDRASQVSITFKSFTEYKIVDEPILKCTVIDPLIQQTIACIPVKVTVCSLFSKYKIVPQNDINFGTIVVGNKKSRKFTIENIGDRFDFRYSIYKKSQLISIPTTIKRNTQIDKKHGKSTISPAIKIDGGKNIDSTQLNVPQINANGGSANAIASLDKNAPEKISSNANASVTQNQNAPHGGTETAVKSALANFNTLAANVQSRLVVGPFIITPAIGVIQPSSSQIITVECAAETTGFWNEELVVDISGRNVEVNEETLIYRLIADAAWPNVDMNNVFNVYEEQQIVESLEIWKRPKTINSLCVYGILENKILFSNVMIGTQRTTRIKLINREMVPCDLSLIIKSTSGNRGGTGGTGSGAATSTGFGRQSALQRVADYYVIEPNKIHIEANSIAYPSIKFTPTSLLTYYGHLEILVDGSSLTGKNKALGVDLMGEGVLPHITIQKPSTLNHDETSIIVFNKLPLFCSQTQKLVLHNDGTMIANVQINVIDTQDQFEIEKGLNNDTSNHKAIKTLNLQINEDEKVEISIVYYAEKFGIIYGQLQICVFDNPYDDIIIQLVGECISSDLIITSIDNYNQNESFDLNHVDFSKPNYIEPRRKKSTQSDNFLDNNAESLQSNQGSQKDKINFVKRGISIKTPTRENEIKFNDISKEREYFKYATLINNSNVIYRWSVNLPDNSGATISISPDIGHILPQSTHYLEITVTFQNEVNEIPISIKMIPISYTKDNVPIWNNLLTHIKWISRVDENTKLTTQRKRLDVIPEPKYTENNEASVSTLILFLCPSFTQQSENLVEIENPTVEDGILGLVDEIFGDNSLQINKHKVIVGKAFLKLMNFSDYITHSRNERLSMGPSLILHNECSFYNKTECMEWNIVGLSKEKIISFIIINPTNHDLNYLVENIDDKNYSDVNNVFLISEKIGSIEANKIKTIHVKCCYNSIGIVESLWQLSIFESDETSFSDHQTNSLVKGDNVVDILMVGNIREPHIAFDQTFINFDDILIGNSISTVVRLVNDEKESLTFAIDEKFINETNEKENVSLNVHPLKGIIENNSSIEFYIDLTIYLADFVNLNIKLMVDGRKYPLTVNIKASGFLQECSLHIINSDQQKTLLRSLPLIEPRNSKNFPKTTHNSSVLGSYINIFEQRMDLNILIVLVVLPMIISYKNPYMDIEYVNETQFFGIPLSFTTHLFRSSRTTLTESFYDAIYLHSLNIYYLIGPIIFPTLLFVYNRIYDLIFSEPLQVNATICFWTNFIIFNLIIPLLIIPINMSYWTNAGHESIAQYIIKYEKHVISTLLIELFLYGFCQDCSNFSNILTTICFQVYILFQTLKPAYNKNFWQTKYINKNTFIKISHITV